MSYLDDAGLLMDTASRQAAPCQHSASHYADVLTRCGKNVFWQMWT